MTFTTQAASAGRRRFITVLFADVVDSSGHAEKLEPEEFVGLLAQFRRLAVETVERHRGSIANVQGDGILALFGHPHPQEDDGRRATEAALDLHEAVDGIRVGVTRDAARIQLHSGIHSGLAYLSDGDLERGRFDVLGEVTNTASRLAKLAQEDEIFVSRGALGRHRYFFRYVDKGLCRVKGRTQLVDILSIRARAPLERSLDSATYRDMVQLSGRETSMASLREASDAASEGACSVVVVSGEAGIGKSRLIDEFQGQLSRDAFTVLQGYCESFLGAEPLQPFMQIVRAALDWRPGASLTENIASASAALSALALPDASALTPTVLRMLGGWRDGQPVSPTKRVAAIVDLIALLAHRHRTVLTIDDWQWTDDASREVLASLRQRGIPVLVLISMRENQGAGDDPSIGDARVIALQPLDDRQSAQAIAAWLPHAEPFIVEAIQRRSGGNPLFIEELCHFAYASGEVQSIPHGSDVAWINSLVASRLEPLPASQVEFIQVASVAGNTCALWLLERLVGEETARDLFQSMAGLDFLVPAEQAGMVRFKHVLARDAVYATVDLAKRRALHRSVAEALESTVVDQDAFEWLEALSYHYDAAGDPERTARYAEAAGDKALSTMALDRARAHYVTALKAMDAGSAFTRETRLRWCSIAQRLGQACVFDVLDLGYVVVLFERAEALAREADDANALARAEYWLAYVYYGKGQPRRAVAYCESALIHARTSQDQRLVAQVQATLGQALASAGRYQQALPLLAEAVESKRLQSRPGSSTAIGSAYTLARMAYTLGDLGEFATAHARFAEALHLLNDHVHAVAASIHELVCAVHLWQGRWHEAVVEGQRGAEIALQCRSRFNTAMGRALAACGEWAADHDPVALERLRESTLWIELRGGAISTSLNYGWLTEASVTNGDYGQARAYAARLFMRARSHDRQGEAMGCRALASLAAVQSRPDRASRYLDFADRAALFRGSLRERAVNLLARAEVARTFGRTTEAATFCVEASRAFATMDMDWHGAKARALMDAL